MTLKRWPFSRTVTLIVSGIVLILAVFALRKPLADSIVHFFVPRAGQTPNIAARINSQYKTAGAIEQNGMQAR